MLTVQFMTLVGKFATAKTETFPTTSEALAAVKAYAEICANALERWTAGRT